jgi:DNA-directed RNA polymerase subunit RPC12/RpoP
MDKKEKPHPITGITSSSPFVYMCVDCGTSTWDRGISLEGDNAGTHTICHECMKKREGR